MKETSVDVCVQLARIVRGEDASSIIKDFNITSNMKTVANLEDVDAETLDFKELMLDQMMIGGSASVNCTVVGSVIGGLKGYRNLPTNWIQHIDKTFITLLDQSLNTLFDLMGVP